MTPEGLAAIVVALLVVFVLGAIWMSNHDRDLIAAQPAPEIHNTATATAGGGGESKSSVASFAVVAIIIGGLAVAALTQQPAVVPAARPVSEPVKAVETMAVPTAVQTAVSIPTSIPIPTFVPVAVPVPITASAEEIPVGLWIVATVLLFAIAVVGIGLAIVISIDRNRGSDLGIPGTMPTIDSDVWDRVVEDAERKSGSLQER